VETFYRDRPLNFAHQGACREAPANTLAAFLLAVELGADGIEFDVHLSSDGEVVVIHDFGVDATTDGQGLVRDKTLLTLKRLDAGSWFDPAFSGERIPTLGEVIDVVGQRLLLNIELKTAGLRGEGLAEAVVQMVEGNHLLERVVISSFNPLSLWRVRRLNPSIPIGLLYAPDLPFFLRRPWFRYLLRPEALHPYYTMVDDDYMRWARGQGYRVHTWTVDEPGEMWQLVRRGVDLIITNRPDLLTDLLLAAQRRGG
jgi:glycerophosphoryl diester phosphodiesterase